MIGLMKGNSRDYKHGSQQGQVCYKSDDAENNQKQNSVATGDKEFDFLCISQLIPEFLIHNDEL
ncbi:hypothetical protein MJO28_000196 [Puccinia striiformis f. sp. tritici]|uniref:Uncharacterized protein n=1 Tax=Puccinia striiformis f. sp. tritici TaxID=168172 RepID=A0ACC0EXE9_9BASI|nr:hypothetical protein MJO28_000196 [Puccinia striiformis f. sp. tritici]KAI7967752.1 hypothetical protein MJO29_001029 [Puccinia striiformis f. sp. tritici]